jgi:Sodium/hydrogen exchanger family
VAYTLVGGFVVVVRLSCALPDIQSHLISFQVQLDILDSEREGEMLKEPIDLSHIINRHGQLYMNEVILGTGFGIILGPHVLGIFDPRSWTHVTDALTREIMRIVLATGLFAIGVELPKRYMADHAKSLLIMVVPTMAFGWLVSAGKCWRTHGISRLSYRLLPSASLHPPTFPETRFCIRARHLSMLDSYRPNCQRGRYRSVS